MKPFAVTSAGLALGLAAAFPLARAHVAATTRVTAAGPAVVSSTVVAAPTTTPRGSAPAAARTARVVTVTGPVVPNRYGPVQVQVTLTDGVLTGASAVQLPSADQQSQQISAAAGPQLAAEALRSAGRRVDTVSGASYTSGGYRQSLQAALDTARRTAPVNPS